MYAVSFTLCEHTVMTELTVIHDAHMVKGAWNKARGQVAHAAIPGCWHMVWRWSFSPGSSPIVAGNAVIRNALMVKRGARKSLGIMTHRAILVSRKMAVTLDRPDCASAGMAQHTVIYDTGMIEHRILKGTDYVTDTAILGSWDMAGILFGSYRGSRRIITVTCSTVIHYACMIKSAILEIVADCMARATIGSRGRMRWCFSQGASRCFKVTIVA